MANGNRLLPEDAEFLDTVDLEGLSGLLGGSRPSSVPGATPGILAQPQAPGSPTAPQFPELLTQESDPELLASREKRLGTASLLAAIADAFNRGQALQGKGSETNLQGGVQRQQEQLEQRKRQEQAASIQAENQKRLAEFQQEQGSFERGEQRKGRREDFLFEQDVRERLSEARALRSASIQTAVDTFGQAQRLGILPDGVNPEDFFSDPELHRQLINSVSQESARNRRERVAEMDKSNKEQFQQFDLGLRMARSRFGRGGQIQQPDGTVVNAPSLEQRATMRVFERGVSPQRSQAEMVEFVEEEVERFQTQNEGLLFGVSTLLDEQDDATANEVLERVRQDAMDAWVKAEKQRQVGLEAALEPGEPGAGEILPRAQRGLEQRRSGPTAERVRRSR